jgi:hypothetical protein
MIGKANYKIKIGGQILAKLKSTSQFLFMQGSKSINEITHPHECGPQ